MSRYLCCGIEFSEGLGKYGCPNCNGDRIARLKEDHHMSWKPEVVADRGGAWTGNALRFHTRAEADAYVHDLAGRWIAVTGWRSVPSDDPVTHAWENGRAVPLKT